jgi:hypothetical protein
LVEGEEVIIKRVCTPEDDEYQRCSVMMDDKTIVNIGDLSEYPEDATLTRALGFVYDIPKYLEMAYNAGKSGEALEVIYEGE